MTSKSGHLKAVTLRTLTGLLLLLLASCGGGGGDDAQRQSSEGVWDQMNWDEKNWQ